MTPSSTTLPSVENATGAGDRSGKDCQCPRLHHGDRTRLSDQHWRPWRQGSFPADSASVSVLPVPSWRIRLSWYSMRPLQYSIPKANDWCRYGTANEDPYHDCHRPPPSTIKNADEICVYSMKVKSWNVVSTRNFSRRTAIIRDWMICSLSHRNKILRTLLHPLVLGCYD